MTNGNWKDTDRFKVIYCFINLDTETTDGEYHIDFLDNNGEGFTYEEAVQTAREISLRDGVKWASIREMTGDYSPSHPWDAPGMSISDFI